MVLKLSIKFICFNFVYMQNLMNSSTKNYKQLSISPSTLSGNVTLSTLTILSQNLTISPLQINASKTLSTSALNFSQTNTRSIIGLQNQKQFLRIIDKMPWMNSNVYCKFQPNGYDCNNSGIFIPKFYYDIEMKNCKTFNFGQCVDDFNKFNKFNSLTQCHEKCFEAGIRDIPGGNYSAEVYCRFQPDFGKCTNYYPKWYYDISTRSCRGFSYSGCGGNLNRFDTSQDCMRMCTAEDDIE